MFRIIFIEVFVFVLLIVVSCKKDKPVPEPINSQNPSLIIEFEPTVYSEPLVANTKWYTNLSKDSFTVSKFNYYISNIRFMRSDSTYFVVPESYHLIEHVERKQKIILNAMPEGEYIGLDFLIGVDSLRNVSGSQTGDLDPSKLMFWDWNTGYIFFKLEGKFTTLIWPDEGDYAIHIGGFSGKDNAIQSCQFNLPDTLHLKKQITSKLYFKVKLEEVFQNPVYIDFSYYYATLPNNNAKMIADNYRDMFHLYKVED